MDINKVDPMVEHPSHYIFETGLETIDVIEAFTFDLNQDLKKAMWYLNHLINHDEKMEKEND